MGWPINRMRRVATGLPGSITALALAGDLLFVTSIDPAGPAISGVAADG